MSDTSCCAVCLCVSDEDEDSSMANDQTWGDTDRDYTYDEVSLLYTIILICCGVRIVIMWQSNCLIMLMTWYNILMFVLCNILLH